MTQCVYLFHMTTSGNPVLSSEVRRPLCSYAVTMTNSSALRQNRSNIRPTGEKMYIQNNNPTDGPLTPLNEVCSTTPSISNKHKWILEIEHKLLRIPIGGGGWPVGNLNNPAGRGVKLGTRENKSRKQKGLNPGSPDFKSSTLNHSAKLRSLNLNYT